MLAIYPSPAAVPLGNAATYAVLAASTVTSAGLSKLTGNLGLYPGSSTSGFPPATVTGTTNLATAAALLAANDLTTARNNAAGRVANQVLASAVGGLTLGVGVYKFTSGMSLNGILTLDCALNSAPVFIFQIASTLTVADNAKVVYINKLSGATAPKTFWNAGSSATIGQGATLVGNVMVYQSISVGLSTTTGPLLADNGGVSLLTNIVKVGV
jgi:type VI secretion system secreted protein VgrG